MLVSFIPDYLHGFFGDEYCTTYTHGGNENPYYHTTPRWHWGYRHWLFIFMGITLFIVQVINLICHFSKKKF